MKNTTTIPFMSAIHPSSGWSEIEHKKTYFHESGHAVVARLTGFEVAWVSVDHKFMQRDPLALANKCSPIVENCHETSTALNVIVYSEAA